MLTLWAYARYVEQFKVQSSKSKVFYWLALAFFALGLMSKAMVVTLPFVLLLLDVWPLRRVTGGGWPAFTTFRRGKQAARQKNVVSQPSTFNQLLFEKWPFFALAAGLSVITFLVQRGEAATPSLAQLGLELRLENIITSYVRYLAWTIWPARH